MAVTVVKNVMEENIKVTKMEKTVNDILFNSDST